MAKRARQRSRGSGLGRFAGFLDVAVDGADRVAGFGSDRTHRQTFAAQLADKGALLVGAREVIGARLARPARDSRDGHACSLGYFAQGFSIARDSLAITHR